MAEKRGMPSMLALLGLLAVAGYQNRDKIAQALQGMQGNAPANPAPGNAPASPAPGNAPAQGQPTQAGGGLLDELGGLFGGGAAAGGAGTLTGGLNDLLDSFKNAGHKEVADSWVTPGVPTQGLSPNQVETAIGKDNLDELSRRTGLSYDELVKRLSSTIPETVDRMTPNGNFPQTEDEARQLLTKA